MTSGAFAISTSYTYLPDFNAVVWVAVRDIVITSRQKGSIQSERYLSGILYYLNNYKSVSLCGNFINNDYDFLKIDIEKDSSKSYFVKRSQDKNENTK